MMQYLLRGTSVFVAMLAIFRPVSTLADGLKPVEIGADFPDFKLPDIQGKEHTLAEYKDKIVVFNFSTPECPCSRSVEGALNDLAAAYADKDVVFVGVNSNYFMDSESLRDYAAYAKISYTILKDDDVELADAAGARVTPEIFIKDKGGKIVFHGAPDNRLNPSATPTVFYLKDALEALTAGKPIEHANITPWGCSIRGGETAAADTEHNQKDRDAGAKP